MRKNLLLFLPVLALAVGAVIFTSCGGDDATPAPTASFTYVADGRDVTFTSTSTNAKTYSWDFGDGGTSTEANPAHTYASYGKYTVKLSVTGDGGSANSLPDELTLAKTSAVKIDGSFTEWADVPTLVQSSDGGTITKVKVDYDANKIYFYVEGTADLRGFFDLYFDADNDTTSGYDSPWYPKGFGADYLSEGEFATGQDAADIFKHKGEMQTDWAWDTTTPAGSGAIASSELKVVGGGKAVEFSFVRSAFTDLAAAGFAVAVVDVDGGASWAKLGSLPADNEVGTQPEAKLVFVDLTK